MFDNNKPGKIPAGVPIEPRLTHAGDNTPCKSQKVFSLKGRGQRYLSRETQLSQPYNAPTSASHYAPTSASHYSPPHNSPYESAHDSAYESSLDSPYTHHTIVSNE